MRAINSTRLKLGAVAVAGASLLAAACGAGDYEAARAQTLAAGAAPMVISCQPNERAIVRPTPLNGTIVSQVECARAAPAAAGYMAPAAAPVAYQAYAPQAEAAPSAVDDTRIVRTAYPELTVERPRQIETRRPVTVQRAGRTWKKSAVIIGSSAGIGAGLGAAMGGKKGALIGAAIGGGSAAIWDQVTRKK